MKKIRQLINKVDFTKPKNKIYLTSYYKSLLNSKQFQNIESYCIFIGYQRSGSSLIGALLDAHPNAVIAHELNVMQYFEANFNKNQIYYLLQQNSQEYAEKGRNWSGYSYQVPNQWQGKFTEIKVIGDKKAALSAIKLSKNPQLLEQIKKTVAVPIKIIHIMRNPYDNITTMFKKSDRKRTKALNFRETIEYYFSLCDDISKIKQLVPNDIVFDIKQESVINNSQKKLQELCAFLNLEADEAYLQDCASIIFKSPRKTRETIDWKPEDIELVAQKMNNYNFLQGYSFAD